MTTLRDSVHSSLLQSIKVLGLPDQLEEKAFVDKRRLPNSKQSIQLFGTIEKAIVKKLSSKSYRQKAIVKKLSSKSYRPADVNQCDRKGGSPLQCVVTQGILAVCELLLRRGASVNHCNMNGFQSSRTALHLAALVGLPEMCKLLIDFGASLEAVDQVWPDSKLEVTMLWHVDIWGLCRRDTLLWI